MEHILDNALTNRDFEHLKSKNVELCISQGCQRFETSVFFSEKINISTTEGSRVGFFQPDTSPP